MEANFHYSGIQDAFYMSDGFFRPGAVPRVAVSRRHQAGGGHVGGCQGGQRLTLYHTGQPLTHHKSKRRNIWIRDVFCYRLPNKTHLETTFCNKEVFSKPRFHV